MNALAGHMTLDTYLHGTAQQFPVDGNDSGGGQNLAEVLQSCEGRYQRS